MLIRLPMLVLWALICWLLRACFWPIALWDERRDRRWRRWFFARWARVHLWIMGAQVRVVGTPPEPPFYLVANHLSYVDIFLITSQTGCGFVARGDMEKWPLVGTACKSLYILFIDRTSKRDAARVNELIALTLRLDDGITVFPESRISRGIDVEPFKSALIQPALNIGAPIHYAALSYATPGEALPANEVVGWWRPEPMMYHVRRLLSQPGFEATITFGEEPISGSDRKKLCQTLHEAVRQKFKPVN